MEGKTMPKNKFLAGKDYTSAVKQLLREGRDLRIAVAFWGFGADEMLVASSGARLICNLESGATNPEVIKRLLSVAKVRSYDKLHAKVIIDREVVIIGSANLSANGLSYEGPESLSGWSEAGLVTDDPVIRSDAEAWFERTWEASSIKSISKAHLDVALAKWRNRRSFSDVVSEEFGLIADLPEEMIVGQKVSFVLYEDVEISPAATEELARLRSEARDDALDCWEGIPDLPHDTALLGVRFDSTGALSLDELVWQRTHNGDIDSQDGYSIQPVLPAPAVLGRPYSKKERARLKAVCASALGKIWNSGQPDKYVVPLEDVIRMARSVTE